jgi:hypothetical protein
VYFGYAYALRFLAIFNGLVARQGDSPSDKVENRNHPTAGLQNYALVVEDVEMPPLHRLDMVVAVHQGSS